MKKILFSAVFLLMSSFAFADGEQWLLVTDQNLEVPVANVNYLIAADNDTEFTVVLNEGEPIYNVLSATFKQGTVVNGIDNVAAGNGKASVLMAGSRLTLSQLKAGERVAVYSLAGVEQKVRVERAADVVVDVASLPTGTYLLKVGKQSIKFMKK